jgi:hypothetical protein
MIILILFAILLVSFVLFIVISKIIAGRKRREAEERREERERADRGCYNLGVHVPTEEEVRRQTEEEIIYDNEVQSRAGIFKEHHEDTALLVSKLMQAEPAEYGKKAAVFFITLGSEFATDVFKYLRDDEVENITYKIAFLENITREQKEAISQEFQELMTAYQFKKSGDTDKARELLEKTLGSQKADGLINLLTRTV